MTPWIAGLRVGHWTDAAAGTGCTVILPPPGTVAAVDVRGGGASTRESDLLGPGSSVPGITALLLTGGSAYGLSAAAGVVDWCRDHGLGHDVGVAKVPIVPAAVIFDLGITGFARQPGPDDARAACEALSDAPPARGSVGAGTGATVGKFFGADGYCKGGFGIGSATTYEGGRVVAMAVVNAFGDILDERGEVLAGAWRPDLGFVHAARYGLEAPPSHPRLAPGNTTLVCVVTDSTLTRTEAGHVARMASAGMARAISPVNTPLDGDVVYVLATGARPGGVVADGLAAAAATEAAIRDAVRSATAVRGVATAAQRRSMAGSAPS